MYSIAKVLYGVPVVVNFDDFYQEIEEQFHEENPGETYVRELEKAFENEQEGFLGYYSGSSDDPPRAFAVELSEFDECCSHIDLSTLTLEATPEQMKKYHENYAQLSEELQEHIALFGQPRNFILWTTS